MKVLDPKEFAQILEWNFYWVWDSIQNKGSFPDGYYIGCKETFAHQIACWVSKVCDVSVPTSEIVEGIFWDTKKTAEDWEKILNNMIQQQEIVSKIQQSIIETRNDTNHMIFQMPNDNRAVFMVKEKLNKLGLDCYKLCDGSWIVIWK